jgi:transposase
MDELNKDKRREVIGAFYKANREKGKSFTVNHFKSMNIGKSTTYRIIERVDNNLSLKRAKGQGRKAVKMHKNKIENFVAFIDGRIGVTQRKVAKKFKISQTYVAKLIKFYRMKRWKRKTRPKVTEKQKILQKIRLNKMRRTIAKPSTKVQIVIDDESYFPIEDKKCSRNDSFYAFDIENVDPNVKYKNVGKFTTKLLVWIAFSSRGFAKPFFMRSRGAINAKTYSKRCIIKRLVPFLREKHSDNNYLFWPDLASSHYANETLKTFNEHNVKFVPKDMNPPNVPQLRPIEDLWAQIKRKVYENDWSTDSIPKLKRRIRKKLKEFSLSMCQSYMRDILTRIRVAADQGVESLIH